MTAKNSWFYFMFLLTPVGVLHEQCRTLGLSSMTDLSNKNIQRKGCEGAACGTYYQWQNLKWPQLLDSVGKLWGPQGCWKWMRDAGSKDGQTITGKSCPDAWQTVVAGHWHTFCQRAGSVHGVLPTAHLLELEPQSRFVYPGLLLPTDSFFTISNYCRSWRWALAWPKQWI